MNYFSKDILLITCCFRLYKERLNQIEQKLKEVYSGRAVEYLNPLNELQEQMRSRTQIARMLKGYRLENLENKYAAEEQSAYQDFQSKKSLLIDQIRESLQEKIRHLDEDRKHLENNDFIWSESGLKKNEKNKNGDKRKKPVVVSGPYMVYMLSDQDVLEDWNIIRKALTRKEV